MIDKTNCSNCKLNEEYEVDGKKYPICVNEYLSGTPDGTIHDWKRYISK